jgi:hypothetical protein
MTTTRTFRYFLPDSSKGTITVPSTMNFGDLLNEVKTQTGRSDHTACRRREFGCPFAAAAKVMDCLSDELEFYSDPLGKCKIRYKYHGLPDGPPGMKIISFVPSTTLQNVAESAPCHPPSGDLGISKVQVEGIQKDFDDLFSSVASLRQVIAFDIFYGPVIPKLVDPGSREFLLQD